MLHVVKLIQRRYASRSDRIIVSLVALSASALLVGIGLLLWQ
jgi:hypothetical protein